MFILFPKKSHFMNILKLFFLILQNKNIIYINIYMIINKHFTVRYNTYVTLNMIILTLHYLIYIAFQVITIFLVSL